MLDPSKIKHNVANIINPQLKLVELGNYYLT